MSWACLDDGFHDDPRTLEVGLAAAGLYACATCYVARHLLDGVIPRRALERMLGDDTMPLDALLRVGLLVEGDDGYELTRYFEGNERREVVLQRRQRTKDRKEKWQKRKAKERATKARATADADF